jgi:hypothetical protein
MGFHIFVIEDKAPLRSVPELVVHRHLRCLVVCFILFITNQITFMKALINSIRYRALKNARNGKLFNFCTLLAGGMLLVTLLVPIDMKAQCPAMGGCPAAPPLSPLAGATNPNGGTFENWWCTSGPVPLTISGGCSVSYCFCKRTITNWPINGTNTTQMVVTCITPSAGCSSTDFSLILDKVREDLENRIDPAPCSGGYTLTHGEIHLPACWMKVDAYDDVTICGDVTCVETCDFCYTQITDPNHPLDPPKPVIQKFNCSFGYTSTPNCGGGTMEGPVSGWTQNVCYQYDCGAHPH